MDNYSLSPIVLFVYNRPVHTEKTLLALSKNYLADRSELYVFCDGPKQNLAEREKINQVLDILEKYKNSFKQIFVIKSDKNKGCANSIIEGIDFIFRKYTKAIIIEDDIITSKWFLNFINKGLNLFEFRDNIGSIVGFIEPIETNLNETFLLTKVNSWGWGTWKRVWKTINWNAEDLYNEIMRVEDRDLYNFGGLNFEKMLVDQIEQKIDAWDIQFYTSCFLANFHHITPPFSLSKNIGLDNSGTHCGPDAFLNKIQLVDKNILPIENPKDLSQLVHALLVKERKKIARKEKVAYYKKRIKEIRLAELLEIIKRKLNH